MYKGLNCDRKSQLSGILTEPSNPRGLAHFLLTRRNGDIMEVKNFWIQKNDVTFHICSRLRD